MAITINDETHLKEIAFIADAHEEIELSDTVFEHSGKEKFKERVKLEGLNKVMKQKEVYEKNLGIRLIPVGFRDSRTEQEPTPGAEMLEEVIVTGIRASDGYSSTKSRERTRSHETSFDEITYKSNISVDFKIVK